MDIPQQDLKGLIEEGSKLMQAGCKIQDCRSIYWYLKAKSALDRLCLQTEMSDQFRYSLLLEERVKILQTIFKG